MQDGFCSIVSILWYGSHALNIQYDDITSVRSKPKILLQVWNSSASSFQISLDLSSQEKFGSLLRTVLHVFSQVLEIAGLVETGRHAEEMLGYLKATIAMEATASILCVQQVQRGN